jgi:hypothetical protein
MDLPRPADAAQMALRNLRNAPKQRLGVRRPRRNEEPGRDSVPLFAPIPDKDAPITFPPTGLFGGSIQAPSSFSFSAGSNINFAAEREKLGLNLPNDQAQDPNRYAGDDRAIKRQFGGKSTELRNEAPTARRREFRPDPGESQDNTSTFKFFGSNPNGNAFGAPKPAESHDNTPTFKLFGANPNGNAFGAPKPAESHNNTPTFKFLGSNSNGNAFGAPKLAESNDNTSTFKLFGSNPNGNAFGSSQAPDQPQPQGSMFSSQPAQNKNFNGNFTPTLDSHLQLPGNQYFDPTQASDPSLQFLGNQYFDPAQALAQAGQSCTNPAPQLDSYLNFVANQSLGGQLNFDAAQAMMAQQSIDHNYGSFVPSFNLSMNCSANQRMGPMGNVCETSNYYTNFDIAHATSTNTDGTQSGHTNFSLNQPHTQEAISGFGQQNDTFPSNPTQSSIFGSGQNNTFPPSQHQSQESSSVFDQNNVSSSIQPQSSIFAFGQNNASSNQPQSSMFGFGQSNTFPPSQESILGSPPPQPSNLFGAPKPLVSLNCVLMH